MQEPDITVSDSFPLNRETLYLECIQGHRELDRKGVASFKITDRDGRGHEQQYLCVSPFDADQDTVLRGALNATYQGVVPPILSVSDPRSLVVTRLTLPERQMMYFSKELENIKATLTTLNTQRHRTAIVIREQQTRIEELKHRVMKLKGKLKK
jgi:hypothetical protein